MDGEIAPDRVAELLEAEADLEIVDVREPVEFDAEHIPGSVNVPMSDLASQADRLDGADHIVTVCPRGEASKQAARLLAAYEGTADARIESMAGGLDAWEGALTGVDGHPEASPDSP